MGRSSTARKTSPRDVASKAARQRPSVLDLTRELGNVAEACRQLGMDHFTEFETRPGLKYIHASGSLAETGERVVVSFGPEHAALEQRQVELAQ